MIPSTEDLAVVGDKAAGIFELARRPNPLKTLIQQGYEKHSGDGSLNGLSAADKIRKRSRCAKVESIFDGDLSLSAKPNVLTEEDAAMMAAIKSNDLATIGKICRKPLTRSVNGQQGLRDQVCATMLSSKR